MADGLYSTYNLERLGIDILEAAPDLLVTPNRSRMIHDYIAGTAMKVMSHQVDVVQEARRSWLDVQERTLLHEVFVTKIDALYNLHAILEHMPCSRIERMILKGLYNRYSFDMSLLKQLVNVKCDICMRAKIKDGKHTDTLHTSTIPWRMFAMDITGPFMQASIKGNRYQCIIIDTCRKYVWTYFIVTKNEVYSIISDFCETDIVK
jgi:hypothetical protein